MLTTERRADTSLGAKEVEMHKAKLLAIHCIDLRFQKMIDEDIQNRAEYGEFDRISLPGTSKDFEIAKNYALVSLRLHDPDEVLIYEHEDCGAYGEKNSNEAHRTNAQKLKEALLEAKPDLKVHTLIATFDAVEQL